jgi:transcriptional regulator of acetoin/glycerol metabolism
LDDLETWAINHALKHTNNNVTQAAKLLGIARDTLHTKIKKKNLDRPLTD